MPSKRNRQLKIDSAFVTVVRVLIILLCAYELSVRFVLGTPGDVLRRRYGISVAAIYFPQYHVDVNNDVFWGKDFTEWKHLHNLSFDPVARHEILLPQTEYTLELNTRLNLSPLN